MMASRLVVRRSVGLLVLIGLFLGSFVGGLWLAPLPAPPVAHAVSFEVTNGNDSGNGSLRQAILDANGNGEADTITFAPNVTTVTLTSAQLEISDDLTIDGGDGVTVERDDGAPDFRIFEISGNNTEVTLDSLTIRNGVSGLNGGGIRNSGTVTVTSSTLSDNEAGAAGGGIYSGSGTVTVTDSTLSGNTAGNIGGGIFNQPGSTVTVTNSEISDNSATSGGGGISNTGTLTVTDSEISGNTATTGNGGGIRNSGTVMVTGSEISGNTATGGGGSGIFNGTDGTVTVTNSTISDNTPLVFGGGIRNEGGEVTVTNSTLSGNQAGSGGGGGISNSGGGTVNVTDSTISDNSANFDNGGGIFNGTDGTLEVTNSTFSGNKATTGNGGGISNTGTMTVTDSTFSGNEAGSDGGGILNDGGMLTVTNSTLSGNTVKGDGGGILNSDVGTLQLTNSTLSGNSATNGGGILNAGGGRMTLANTIVANSPDGGDVDNTSILSAEGQNIISDTSISGTNITNGTDPQLGPLQDNGGPTFTHLPDPATSPAVDAGDNTVATNASLTTDQRGLARINNTTVDIGAVELQQIFSTISIDPDTLEEGDSGDTPTATVNVARTGGTTLTSSVDLSLGGDATENTDYTFALAAGSAGSFDSGTGTLNFAADETEATFTITVQGDDVVEPDETVEITLANPTAPEGASITPPDAVTLTIQDDDHIIYLPIIIR